MGLPTTPVGPQGAPGGSIAKGTIPGSGATSSKAPGAIAGEAAEGAPSLENSGPILAVEALTVATLNVVSFAIMATGGALWYLDIASMEEMRQKVRGGLGVDGTGRTEQEAEEEMEEWLATVLARKEGKDESRAREAVEAREGTRGGKWRVRD